jgi:hypothetical protein
MSDKTKKWIPVVVYFNEEHLKDLLAEPREEIDDMPEELQDKMLSNFIEAKEDLQKGFDITSIHYEKVLKYGFSDIG